MERIAAIIQQLQDALQSKQDAAQMLTLTGLLQAELQLLQNQTPPSTGSSRVAVVLPAALSIASPDLPVKAEQHAAAIAPTPPASEEKVFEILRVDEQELEAELEEIKQKAAFVNKVQTQQRMVPGLLFEPEPEIPTLVHQPNYQSAALNQEVAREVNESIANHHSSLNDQLASSTPELAQKLSEQPVKDLKKAIGINDRYVFINELFRGDEAMYERSIKTIDGFTIFAEAEYWIQRELKIKLGWEDSHEIVAAFYALVRRRFS